MAILYRSNALSRGLEETLMRARISSVLVGDVGFYQRAEIKDSLALLQLAATPDSPTVCRDTAATEEEDEGTRFLNVYDCPCGKSWSSEHDCTCDDRCPTCAGTAALDCWPIWTGQPDPAADCNA